MWLRPMFSLGAMWLRSRHNLGVTWPRNIPNLSAILLKWLILCLGAMKFSLGGYV